MLEAIRFVKKVYIGPDTGKILDFAPLLDEVKPDIFFVNSDGTSDEKKAFVEAKGIRYVTSSRIPHGNLPERSTTSIRQTLNK
jgi:glycerol-3-phosphate cytidylyltransferase-like family protein